MQQQQQHGDNKGTGGGDEAPKDEHSHSNNFHLPLSRLVALPHPRPPPNQPQKQAELSFLASDQPSADADALQDVNEDDADDSAGPKQRQRAGKRKAAGATQKNIRGDPHLAEGIPRIIEIASELLYAPGVEKSESSEGQLVDSSTVCKRARQFVLTQVKEWANKVGFLVHLKGTAEGNAFLISCHRYGRTNDRNPARCGCQWVVRYVFDEETSTAFIRSYPHHAHNHSLGKSTSRHGGVMYIEDNRPRSDRMSKNISIHGMPVGDETEGSYGSEDAGRETRKLGEHDRSRLASSWSVPSRVAVASSDQDQQHVDHERTIDISHIDMQLETAWSAIKAWAQSSPNAQRLLLAMLRKFPVLVNDAHFRRQMLGEDRAEDIHTGRVEQPSKAPRVADTSRSVGSSYPDAQQVDFGSVYPGHVSYALPGMNSPHFDYHSKPYVHHHTGEGFAAMHQVHQLPYRGRPPPYYPTHTLADSSAISSYGGSNALTHTSFDRSMLSYPDYNAEPQRYSQVPIAPRTLNNPVTWTAGEVPGSLHASPSRPPSMSLQQFRHGHGMMIQERQGSVPVTFAEWDQQPQHSQPVPQLNQPNIRVSESPPKTNEGGAPDNSHPDTGPWKDM